MRYINIRLRVHSMHVFYSESRHLFNYSNHLLTGNTLGNFTTEGHIYPYTMSRQLRFA